MMITATNQSGPHNSKICLLTSQPSQEINSFVKNWKYNNGARSSKVHQFDQRLDCEGKKTWINFIISSRNLQGYYDSWKN